MSELAAYLQRHVTMCRNTIRPRWPLNSDRRGARRSDGTAAAARRLIELRRRKKGMNMPADRGMTMLFAAAAALSAACGKPAPAAPPPPPEVYVTNVVQKDVPVNLDLVGQT